MCRASLRNLLLSLLIAVGTAVAAEPSPATPAPAKTVKQSAGQRMRPNGPVAINADNCDWTKNGLGVCTGNVKLTSDTLNMDGDRLELEQLDNGQYKAKVTGAPAHLLHQGGEPDAQGQPDPPVTARGKTLIYDSKDGIADVIGDARVTRDEDEITGETIHYNVNERRIQAAGGSGGQVKIVIQPNNKNAGPAAPTPAAPAAAKPAQP
jgi:lipopolysaccharide export system protein LptA